MAAFDHDRLGDSLVGQIPQLRDLPLERLGGVEPQANIGTGPLMATWHPRATAIVMQTERSR